MHLPVLPVNHWLILVSHHDIVIILAILATCDIKLSQMYELKEPWLVGVFKKALLHELVTIYQIIPMIPHLKYLNFQCIFFFQGFFPYM